MNLLKDFSALPPAKRRWLWAALAFSVVILLAQVISRSTWVNIAPLDGQFQGFNQFRRISAGQWPGRDFPTFHGIGLPWLHYPIFALFGGTFQASVMASYLLLLLLACAAAWSLFRLLMQGRGAWVYSIIFVALMDGLPYIRQYFLRPGNSLIGTRSWLVIFLGLLIASLLTSQRLRSWQSPAAGALAGFGLFCFTDQGTSLALAVAGCLALRFLWAPTGEPVPWWRQTGAGIVGAAAFLVCTAFAYVMLIWLSCGPDTARVLAYYWRVLPGDQFWYFGSYPNTWLRFYREIYQPTIWRQFIVPFLVVAALFAGLFRRLSLSLRAGGFILIGYGVASMLPNLGSVSTAYFHSQAKATVFLAVICLATLLQQVEFPVAAVGRWRKWSAPVLAILFVGIVSTGIIRDERRLMALAPQWERLEGEKTPLLPAVRIPESYLALLKTFGSTMVMRHDPVPGDALLWSQYAGLLESIHNTFHPHTDFIIASLGDAGRAEYAAQFRASEPQFVQTLDLSRPPYAAWLLHHHWDFYEELLRQYRVRNREQSMTFWERMPQPAPWRSSPTDRVEVLPGAEFPLEHRGRNTAAAPAAEEVHLYVATLTYRTPLAGLPKLPGRAKLTRVILTKENALNASASGQSMAVEEPVTLQVPLIVLGSGKAKIGLMADGLFGTAPVELIHASAVEITGLSSETLLYLASVNGTMDPE